MSEPTLRILAFAGSLRAASYNRGLLRAARDVAPHGVTVDTFDLADVPLYNEDLNADGTPNAVAALRSAIGQADAILIATPEYNGSMSGVLKNAVDWASRPFGRSGLIDKPVAIIGASAGRSGTAGAQRDLRTLLTALGCYVLPKPRLLVSAAGEKFSPEGELTDDATRQQLSDLLQALVSWQRMLQSRPT